MEKDTGLVQHYTSLAEKYNEVWYLSDGYRQWVVDAIIHELDLHQEDILVDLAGGTGVAAEMLYTRASLQHHVLCVDICHEMLNEAQSRHGVTQLCMDAHDFIHQNDILYHKLVIKEAIHHFHQRYLVFTGIYRQLPPAGRMLILTRPPRTEFPFFETAHAEFKHGQPHYSIFQQELEQAGFEVEIHIRTYPLTLPKEQWFDMLKQRFMSHLSLFTDEQITTGIAELHERYKDTETFNFADNLVFITCKKHHK